jgi:hypothetical protein
MVLLTKEMATINAQTVGRLWANDAGTCKHLAMALLSPTPWTPAEASEGL